MKHLLSLLALCAIAIAPAGAYAQSTENAKSLSDGLHIGGKTTDRVGFHNATPTDQCATTVTAYGCLIEKGLIATGADYSVQHKTVALTAAQMIAMYTTPVEILPAPGAGKSIVITKLVFKITRTATAFTGGGAAIVQYANTANGGGTQALDSTIASTVMTGAAGTTVTARNGAVLSDLASASIVNVGVYISNATAVFAAGTGTATVDVWYVVQ